MFSNILYEFIISSLVLHVPVHLNLLELNTSTFLYLSVAGYVLLYNPIKLNCIFDFKV
jgi:hypothetical protein